MFLTKYPITTPVGTYSVEIYDYDEGVGFHSLRVKIMQKVPTRFKIIKSEKFKTVYKYNSGLNMYNFWSGRYIALATEAVKKYEEEIRETEISRSHREKGLSDWKQWDGVIK